MVNLKRIVCKSLAIALSFLMLLAGLPLDATVMAAKQQKDREAIQVLAAPQPVLNLGSEPQWTFYTMNLGSSGEIKVNLFTGNLVYSTADLVFDGVSFKRVYNSMGSGSPSVGEGWRLNYDCNVVEDIDGSVLYTDDDGTTFRYTKNLNGTYNTPVGLDKVLTRVVEDQVYFILSSKDGNYREYYTLDSKIARIVQEGGQIITFKYAGGVLSTVNGPTGQLVNAIPGADGKISTIADPTGRAITYLRDSAGNLIHAMKPEQFSVGYNYNTPEHLLTTIVDGNQFPTLITYDETGRVKSIRNANNETVSFVYNSGTTVVTTPNSQNYSYSFSTQGMVTSIIEPGNVTTTYGWDLNNNLTSVTDANHNTRYSTYTPDGRILDATTAMDGKTIYNYDSNKNLTSVKDPENIGSFYSYDAQNRVTAISDDLNNTVKIDYDELIKGITITDANGNPARYEYDDRGNVIRVVDALGAESLYTYDQYNNLTETIIKKGEDIFSSTTYTYDKLNRLTAIKDPDGNLTSQSYDSNGNLKLIQYQDGQKVEYTYTPTNQLESIAYNGIVQYEFKYDLGGNLISATQPGETQPFVNSYDAKSRLTQTKEPNGNLVNYIYDNVGNMTEINLNAEGYIYNLHYKYDRNNQVTSLTEYGGKTVILQNGANGRVDGVTYPNGVEKVVTYNAANRVMNFADTLNTKTIIQESYTYDKNGNHLTKTDTNGKVWVYTYDKLNQLTSETDPYTGEKTVYTYDPNGNRTNKTVCNPDGSTKDSIDYSYEQSGTVATQNFGTVKYVYDWRGNVISDGTFNYTWDAFNRLIEVRYAETGVTVATYTYDSQGRRLSKTTPKGTTYYHYIGNRVAYETDQNGVIILMYTYTPTGIPLTMYYQGQTYYYHTNSRGDVLAITDAHGNIVAEYRYDAWGNTVYMSGPLSSINPYRFGGFICDEETGLYYIHGRYYDPRSGRFLSRLPYFPWPGIPIWWNPWIYCFNNPLMLIWNGWFWWSPWWGRWWWAWWGPWIIWCPCCGHFLSPWWNPWWNPWWGPWWGPWWNPWWGPWWSPWWGSWWSPWWGSWWWPWWGPCWGSWWWPWWSPYWGPWWDPWWNPWWWPWCRF